MTTTSDPPHPRSLVRALAVALAVHGILLAFTGASAPVARGAPPALTDAASEHTILLDAELDETPVTTFVAAPPARGPSDEAGRPRAIAPARAQRPAGPPRLLALDDPGEGVNARGEDTGGAPSEGGRGDLLSASGGAPAGVARSMARGPRLLSGESACQRFFPYAAHVDTGAVMIAVEVSPTGNADAVRVLDERPPSDGFGSAATSCVRGFRFAPAIGGDGLPLTATATLRLEFVRRARRRT